jgi:phosphatidylglycerophosphate synthase
MSRSPVVILVPPLSRDVEGRLLRRLLGVPLILRPILTLMEQGFTHVVVMVPPRLRRATLKAWRHYGAQSSGQLTVVSTPCEDQLATRVAVLDATTLITPRWVTEILRPALTDGTPIAGARIIDHPTAGRLHTRRRATQATRGADLCLREAHTDVARAEHFLCEAIRQGARGWAARNLNKRISLPLSRLLARLRVSPNAITICNMLVGLAAGIGTAGVTYVGLLWGGIFFQLASILDGCDGEVAKLTHRATPFGQMIDTISDNFALASFFVGLTIHHFRTGDVLTATLWSGFLFGGLGLLLACMIRFLRRHTASMSLVTFHTAYLEPLAAHHRGVIQWLLCDGKEALKKEWYSLVFFLLALCGLLPVVFHLATVALWISLAILGGAAVARARHPAFMPQPIQEKANVAF